MKEITVQAAGDPASSVAMTSAVLMSWFLFGVEWIDAHSGFFVSIGAMVSTGVAVWGACRNARKKAKRNTDCSEKAD